ncbi:MAG: hypothetical protein ACK4SY_02505 [Pyrobaculum sp.]
MLKSIGAVEIETSGVYSPSERLDSCVDLYDVSPELSNAGVKAPLITSRAQRPGLSL